MSTFSNTNTAGKTADPTTAANIDRNVPLKQKIEDLSEFITSRKFGMMTTRDVKTGKLVSRAMALAGKEAGDIDLVFTTNTESHKTDELAADPHVNISFIDSSGQWASIAGDAHVETDRETVKKYYSSSLKAWLGDLGDGKHDGSKNDPRLGVIRVRTSTATYLLTNKTAVTRAAEVARGALTGSPPEIGKLREISELEVQQWRSIAT
ncbi:Protein bli-3 [Pestalotiopsis fici W106-1]|uniref:Protein bli-3 n=1 Tax=Pestalotiopsis fici (strain W106-1 / CGMCC3.15140) TaxID=1229662 RepID=W3WSS8_PESFW|nr:Protein bli-3 [Pestalotiopsis fici W106-1]ETS76864.1 Protein bli-3 [Pestalotiopsis fici W106-1]